MDQTRPKADLLAAGRGRERERQKSGQIIVGNNDKRINWRDLWPKGQKFSPCVSKTATWSLSRK